jgi:hypothetical protein
MLKKVLAAVFLTTVVSSIYLSIMDSTTPRGIQVGQEVPGFSFRSVAGSADSVSNESSTTIVCLFQSECHHCQRQLKSFESNVDHMLGMKLILLSDEHDLFSKVGGLYPGLQNTDVIRWGIVDRQAFEQIFGVNGTPATYIISEGKLISKFKGEVEFDKIRDVLAQGS